MRARHLWQRGASAASIFLLAAGAAAREDPPTTTEERPAAVAEGEPEEPLATHGDEIVVTAGRTEQRVRDVPVPVTVLDREDVESSPVGAIDDFVRQLPSFNSQRPGSSRGLDVANQGVSLRGLGGSSASRALILVDGVPLNEPFAGFVSWSRVPLATVEKIEVVPGAGAGAWGSQSLSGVIQLFTRRPQPARFEADLKYGSRSTVDATLLASHVVGPWAFGAHASAFDTDGYWEIPDEWRGPADERIALENRVADARVEYAASSSSRFTGQGTWLLEERAAGSALSADELELLSLRTSYERHLDSGAVVRGQAFGVGREAWNRRGTINDDRTEVAPRRDQYDNPSRTLGADFSWSRPVFEDHLVTAGIDAQQTRSELHENTGWTGSAWGQHYDSEGEQLLAGAYLQDAAILGPRWRLAAGGRIDLWRTADGIFHGVNLLTGEVTYDRRLEDRSEVVFSPNLGLRYDAGEKVDLRAAAYQGFRAPTPNEMLKSSPSSRAFVAANNDLDPERVRLGLEAGFDWTPAPSIVARATGFWIDVEGAILDVVMGVAGSAPEVIEPCGRLLPRGVCQQRQNIEQLRSKGLETDVDWRPPGPWRFWAAYTYTDSRILESAIDRSIEGNWVRRVPRHQGTARATYDSARLFSTTLQVRYQGERWEDNTNELVIGDAWIADVRLSRPFGNELETFVTVENLLDEEVQVGRNEDFGEIAAPRTISAGIVWRFDGAAR